MTNRREFISQGTTLLAGVLAGPRIGRLEHPAPPLGVALVGLGNLSTYQLAPALRKTSNCRLAAIVTGTPAKAARWKAQYDIPDRSIYDYATMDRMAEQQSGMDLVWNLVGAVGLLGLLGLRKEHPEDSYHPASLE